MTLIKETIEFFGQGAIDAYIAHYRNWNSEHFEDAFSEYISKDTAEDRRRILIDAFYANHCILGDEELEQFEQWADWDKIVDAMSAEFWEVKGTDGRVYWFYVRADELIEFDEDIENLVDPLLNL
jgi:hypothetical protein